MLSEPYHDGKELIQRPCHVGGLIGHVALCMINLHHLFIYLVILEGAYGILSAQVGLVQQQGCVCSIKAHPTVFPGILSVGLIKNICVRIGDKELTGAQGIGSAKNLIVALASNHIVQEIVIPHTRPPAIAAQALLDTRIAH